VQYAVMRPVRHVLLAALAVLVLAGCGDEAGDGASEPAGVQPQGTY
jgi:hypothetical protein